jgi:hypothetical protein
MGLTSGPSVKIGMRWPSLVRLADVSTRIPNLADPSFEPTDEQFAQLTRAAFAHLGEAKREADERLARQIAQLRAESLARLDVRRTEK